MTDNMELWTSFYSLIGPSGVALTTLLWEKRL